MIIPLIALFCNSQDLGVSHTYFTQMVEFDTSFPRGSPGMCINPFVPFSWPMGGSIKNVR